MVGTRGFEPLTTCPPGRYATRLRYAPNIFKLLFGPKLSELKIFKPKYMYLKLNA
jgi:hypothetical protein